MGEFLYFMDGVFRGGRGIEPLVELDSARNENQIQRERGATGVVRSGPRLTRTEAMVLSHRLGVRSFDNGGLLWRVFSEMEIL